MRITAHKLEIHLPQNHPDRFSLGTLKAKLTSRATQLALAASRLIAGLSAIIVLLVGTTAFAEKAAILDVRCTWVQSESTPPVEFVFRVDKAPGLMQAGGHEGLLLPTSVDSELPKLFPALSLDQFQPISSQGHMNWYRELKTSQAVSTVRGRYYFSTHGNMNYVDITAILKAKETMVQDTTEFVGTAAVITYSEQKGAVTSHLKMVEMTCRNLTEFNFQKLKI